MSSKSKGRASSKRPLARDSVIYRSSASSTLGKQLRDRISEVREGLPLSELSEVAKLLEIDRSQLAVILGITIRTLQRKAEADERLGAAASDRLARVKRIHELATHVLGEAEKASHWLTSASRPLGGEVPLTMLDTDIGTQRVQQELREIEFGMPF
jgi:putative toxin-antitoxin system antitoxin component (TIGR02293 family)